MVAVSERDEDILVAVAKAHIGDQWCGRMG